MTTHTTLTQPSTGSESMKAEEIVAARNRYVSRSIATYAPSVVVDRAHGAELWDVEGKRYIDFAGGIGVCNAGHTPTEVVEAIKTQAERLIHACFSVAYYEPYIELSRRLCALTPGSFEKKAALFNSGAEAVENAIKLARVATGRTAVIGFHNAFHGRTMMAMTLTGKDEPYRSGFGPFAPDVHHASFPYSYRCECPAHESDCDIESGRDLLKLLADVGEERVAAVIVEPVQGEGGFVVAPAEWLRTVRDICTRHGIIMIADEIQSGYGRTGHMFAVDAAGVVPDLVLMAKSMAAGLPLSAVVGRSEIMDAPVRGGIGGTFGGNPVACAAALAVLELYERDQLVDRARRIGNIVRQRFEEIAGRCGCVGEVRGLGAMQAMELVEDTTTKVPAKELTSQVLARCHQEGLLVIKAGMFDNVIRFLAPLTISKSLLLEGLAILENGMCELS